VVRQGCSVFQSLADCNLAVTHAALSNWEYMEVIRRAADPKCSKNVESAIGTIDALLHTPFRIPLKSLFGLASLESDEDFVSLLQVSTKLVFFSPKIMTCHRVRWAHGRQRTGILKLTVLPSTSSVRVWRSRLMLP
jgi:hypothetical protein